MDYFSVRIDELPTFANGNIMLGDIKTPTQRGDLIKTNATDGKEIP